MSESSVKMVSISNTINGFNMSHNAFDWQVLYLHSGTLTVTLNSSIYLLSPQNLLFISPDDFYYIGQSNSAQYTTVQFKSNHLYDFSSTDKIFELDSTLIDLADALLAEQDQFEQELILKLLLNKCSKLDSDPTTLKDEKARIFSKAITIMERYVASTITVDDLADMLRVSLSYLKRIFLKYTGIGVHEYYLMLKINKAKHLLLSGYSITRTAKVLQFSSQPYFSTAFKRVTGISAKAFSKSGFAFADTRKNETITFNKKRIHTPTSPRRQFQQPAATNPASTSEPAVHRSDLPDYLL